MLGPFGIRSDNLRELIHFPGIQHANVLKHEKLRLRSFATLQSANNQIEVSRAKGLHLMGKPTQS
jgi:hypothetical protein